MNFRLLATSGPAVFSLAVVARKFCVRHLLLPVALMMFFAPRAWAQRARDQESRIVAGRAQQLSPPGPLCPTRTLEFAIRFLAPQT
jgi:hypothetical protein